MLAGVRTALVHHWLVTRGGGERVAEVLAEIFPHAPLYTLFQLPAGTPRGLRSRAIITSPLQKLPGAARMHRYFLPLYPWAVEHLDLRGYKLALISDSGPVKGARVDPDAVTVCYCHAPMRYLWDDYEGYAASMNPLVRSAFRATAGRVRRWDYAAAQRITHFLANSRNVQARIKKFYGRDATVLYPPIDTWRGDAARERKIPAEDFYLHAGRLVPYKRTELAILACNRLGRRLRIAGGGPEEKRLRVLAGPTVEFLGELDTEHLWEQYARCRALIFCANEDFGMVPLEAEACGKPVIAFGAGGSLETVRGHATDAGPATGVWFQEQSGESVVTALQQFEAREQHFDPEAIAAFARQFDIAHFVTGLKQFLHQALPRADWPEEISQADGAR